MKPNDTEHDKRHATLDSWRQAILLSVTAILLAINAVALIRIGFLDLSDGTKFTDWAIVGLTFGNIVVAGLQFWAMHNTVTAMRDSTRVAIDALDHAKETARADLEEARRANALTLRAWLFIEDIQWVPDRDRTTEAHIRVTARNAGRLPASSVSVKITPLTEPLYKPWPTPYPTAIGPAGVVVAAGQVKTFVFTVQDLPVDKLRLTGDAELFFWVNTEIVYSDALGTSGKTTQEAHYLRASPGHAECLVLEREGSDIL